VLPSTIFALGTETWNLAERPQGKLGRNFPAMPARGMAKKPRSFYSSLGFSERGFRESPPYSPSLLKWDRNIGFISQDVKDILTNTLFNVTILGEIGKKDLPAG
jgi:hypothetical protein